jgi:hypothetical protein
MLGTMVLLVLLIYTVNYRSFHAFAKSEMSAPSFQRAFKALLRIKSPDARRYMPITGETLGMAYNASPTFARLQPQLDGPVGEFWRADSLKAPTGVSGEILLNLMIWAVRDAASRVGEHASAAKAEHFYNKIARELNDACDQGRLPSRTVLASFVDPDAPKNLVFLPQSLLRVLRLFVIRYELSPPRDDAILQADERQLYDEIANRRASALVAPPGLSFEIEHLIGRYHWMFVVATAAGAFIATLVLVPRLRVTTFGQSAAIALCILAVAIALRIGFFAFMDATSWKCDFERFLYPVLPLSSALLLLLIAQAIARFTSRNAQNP